MVQKKLSVEGVKKSNIIDIEFEHKSPIVAAKVVNTLIDTFVEHHVDGVQAASETTVSSAKQVKLLVAKAEGI